MGNEKKSSVGLVVLIKVNGGLKAILQVRGRFNHEKMRPESFPGACQVTVHGGLEKGETFDKGLLREARQEVGNSAAKLLEKNFHLLREVSRNETPEKMVITYGVIMPQGFLAKMKLNASTGGIRLVGPEELNNLFELTDRDKNIGAPEDMNALFPDEILAIKKTFRVYTKGVQEVVRQERRPAPQPIVAAAAQ